jgi:hypothetical protein
MKLLGCFMLDNQEQVRKGASAARPADLSGKGVTLRGRVALAPFLTRSTPGSVFHFSKSHPGNTAIPSISTFAASSNKPATWTNTIAGKCLPMCLRYRSPTSLVRSRYSCLSVT